jgi:ankyrin repeat protein
MENFSNSNSFDKNKNTPVHLEISDRCDFSVIKLMLDNSENVKSLVNAANENQQTPLHLASKKGNNNVTKLLLEKSSCVSTVDNDKNTPLHLALAHSGDLDTVKLLLQHSEDVKSLVNAVNENQETALHLAVIKKRSEVVKLLVEKFSNSNAFDKDKNTPLHLEISNKCDFGVIKLMLEHSEDVKCLVNAVNENQQTPLHLASKKGNNSVTKLLLEKSSCVQTVDKDMNTPLHLCLAHSGDLDTVKLLLQHSEDVKHLVSAENKDKKRPLDLAIQNQKRNVAELLNRFDVLHQSGFTIDISEDPESLHALVVFDDFTAIDSFLQVSLTLH